MSDWISDVCSSDLRREEAPGTVAGLYCVAVLQRRKRLHGRRLAGGESIVARVVVVGALRRPHDRRVASAAAEVAGQGVIDHALAGKISVVAGHEIGSASWRASVGQYV